MVCNLLTVISAGTEEDAKQLGSVVAPVMALPDPGIMPGPRPGFPLLQPPAGTPGPHIPPFLSPPNMPHLPPQKMHRGPMFLPERFRMPLPFPPRGPPFHRHFAMEPEGMDDEKVRHFGNGNPGFPHPNFHRGRW